MIQKLKPAFLFQVNFFSSLRQSYLRQGGNNPVLLAQITDLEEEARTYHQPVENSEKHRYGNIHHLYIILLYFVLRSNIIKTATAE